LNDGDQYFQSFAVELSPHFVWHSGLPLEQLLMNIQQKKIVQSKRRFGKWSKWSFQFLVVIALDIFIIPVFLVDLISTSPTNLYNILPGS
jgi:hypothetical protein